MPLPDLEYQIQQVDTDFQPILLVGAASSEQGAYSLAAGMFVAKQVYAKYANFLLGIFDANGLVAWVGRVPTEVE